jgi:hypothetical protein
MSFTHFLPLLSFIISPLHLKASAGETKSLAGRFRRLLPFFKEKLKKIIRKHWHCLESWVRATCHGLQAPKKILVRFSSHNNYGSGYVE